MNYPAYPFNSTYASIPDIIATLLKIMIFFKQKMIVIASIVNRINYRQVLFKGDKIAIKPTKT